MITSDLALCIVTNWTALIVDDVYPALHIVSELILIRRHMITSDWDLLFVSKY